jgi:hypothetical protein
MRYRPLGPDGDYTVGLAFLANTPEAVGQAIETRLRLWLAEFDLDRTDGTPYYTQVLNKRYGVPPDPAIQARILGTACNGQPLVNSITAYSSLYNGTTRALTVSATVDTIYGAVDINVTTSTPTA